MPSTPRIHSIANTKLRPSGLAPVPDVNWGDHISAFFGTVDDLVEIVGDFFSAALAGGEACFWVASAPLTVAQALARLGDQIPDAAEEVARGALEIVEGDEWYLTRGETDFQRVTKGWRAREEIALRNGFEGLRIVGNAFWLQSRFWASFSEFESQLSSITRSTRMII